MNDLKRALLWTFVGLILASAGLGVAAISLPDLFSNNITWRLMGTSCTLALSSLTSAACAAAYEKRKWRPVMAVGLGLSALSALLLLGAIWFDLDLEEPGLLPPLWAIVIAHIGLVSLPRLRTPWSAAMVGAAGAAAALGLLLSAAIFETDLFNEDAFNRLTAILSILGSAATVLVFVGARWGRGLERRPPAVAYAEVRLTCPRCAREATIRPSGDRCAGCGLGMRVEFLADGSP